MESRLEHRTVTIRDLIHDFCNGQIVIPEFQRDYVWRKGKAPKLLDSLYNGYPISSLLIWQSDKDAVVSRRRIPKPTRGSTAYWLIDGQQRLITLARTMSGDDGIEVYFNPDSEQFALANAAIKKEIRSWFSVAQIWHDEDYRRIRRNLDSYRNPDKLEAKLERVRRILDYEVPLVQMCDHSFESAVSAFTRINTLGVRLKSQDIESARVAAKHSGFIVEKVTPFLTKIRDQGFTRMTVMHLFRACAYIAHPDGRNRTPLHELSRKEVTDAWKCTEDATKNAISLIRSEFGLVNMDILWSGTFLVPIICMCATMPPKQRSPREISGWLALAALFHRYSGSSETALEQDLRACRTQDPIRALLANLRASRPDLWASESDFTGSLADRSGLLSLYIACKHRGLLDFYTGGKIVLQDTIDKHHILPRALFSDGRRENADCIANIAFITGGINKSLSSTSSDIYLPKISKKVRESQCIPDKPNLWRVERAADFWEERRRLLAHAFNDFTKESLTDRRLY